MQKKSHTRRQFLSGLVVGVFACFFARKTQASDQPTPAPQRAKTASFATRYLQDVTTVNHHTVSHYDAGGSFLFAVDYAPGITTLIYDGRGRVTQTRG